MCSENTFKYDPDIIDYIQVCIKSHTCITKTANKIINFNNSKEISASEFKVYFDKYMVRVQICGELKTFPIKDYDLETAIYLCIAKIFKSDIPACLYKSISTNKLKEGDVFCYYDKIDEYYVVAPDWGGVQYVLNVVQKEIYPLLKIHLNP